MSDKPLVLFDLDGTLFESESSVVPAMREACRDLGLDIPSRETILERLAYTLTEQVPMYIGTRVDVDPHAFAQQLAKREEELVRENATLFPGILPVLDSLLSCGYSLAVCSSGGQHYVDLVIDTLGIRDRFIACSGQLNEEPKYERAAALAAAHNNAVVCHIGDAHSDALAAEAVGCPFVIADYGYSLSSIPDSTRARAIIASSPSDIPGAIEQAAVRSLAHIGGGNPKQEKTI